MCYVSDEELKAKALKRDAEKRAAVQNKCPGLRAVDRAIQPGRPIGEALAMALPEVRQHNLGAADTIEKLMALEGWNTIKIVKGG